MPLSDYTARCDNCGSCTREESKIGEEHASILCGDGGPGVFIEL